MTAQSSTPIACAWIVRYDRDGAYKIFEHEDEAWMFASRFDAEPAALIEAPAVVSETRQKFDLEGKLLNVLRLADELTSAVDKEEEDIGGSRNSLEILRELGPAVDEANSAVEKAGK